VPSADAQVLEIAGRELRVTSPGKVLFPERGDTKLDLIEYYLAVGEPVMRTMSEGRRSSRSGSATMCPTGSRRRR
jgi:DNA primase